MIVSPWFALCWPMVVSNWLPSTLIVSSNPSNDAIFQWYNIDSDAGDGMPAVNTLTIRPDQAAVAIGTIVYYIGGENESKTATTNVQAFDTTTNTSKTVRSMSTARASHAAVVLTNDCILVCGGYNTLQVVASCEIYTVSTDQWTPTGSLPAALMGFVMVTLTDRTVIALGGETRQLKCSNIAFNAKYDVNSAKWTKLPSSGNTPGRNGHGAALLSTNPDVIVMCAGIVHDNISDTCNFTSQCDSLDTSTMLWSPMTPLPTAISGVAMITSAGTPYVIGGVSAGYVVQKSVLYYENNTWLSKPNGLSAASYFSAAVVIS